MINRQELVGLLEDAECPETCTSGVIPLDSGPMDCPFCSKREHAITSLQAAEPVGYAPTIDGVICHDIFCKTESGAKESAIAMFDCGDVAPLFTLPALPAQVLEGVDAELIADILGDYANLQQSGVISGAGRYSPADAMEQADLLLSAAPQPEQQDHSGDAIATELLISIVNVCGSYVPDCIDNYGNPYQSQSLADWIAVHQAKQGGGND